MSNRSRTEARKGWESNLRIELLESDVDEFENSLSGVRDDLSGVKKLLVGILVSITTASILMVIDILSRSGS